ncbi:MAG: CHAT domain-containing protein, partial [Candidatus Electrothrix sp. AR3]|nr:CHAT domain-containing protein [Candidatus Electrothrix sp. AR3]
MLLLSANADDTIHLLIDREIRQIEHGLSLTEHPLQLVFKTCDIETLPELRRAIQGHQPQILHFRGNGQDGLYFAEQEGPSQLVPADVLSAFFNLFSAQVQGVLLNACYSEMQALAIAQHIDYVIAMNGDISDQISLTFMVTFYEGLSDGKQIEAAYRAACLKIMLFGV